jgi:hypothetical protein
MQLNFLITSFISFSFKDTCLKAKCDTPPYKYVCGSNGITYPNDCFLKSVACVTKSNLTIEYRGPCKENKRCRLGLFFVERKKIKN